jgi:hypothetical protein
MNKLNKIHVYFQSDKLLEKFVIKDWEIFDNHDGIAFYRGTQKKIKKYLQIR